MAVTATLAAAFPPHAVAAALLAAFRRAGKCPWSRQRELGGAVRGTHCVGVSTDGVSASVVRACPRGGAPPATPSCAECGWGSTPTRRASSAWRFALAAGGAADAAGAVSWEPRNPVALPQRHTWSPCPPRWRSPPLARLGVGRGVGDAAGCARWPRVPSSREAPVHGCRADGPAAAATATEQHVRVGTRAGGVQPQRACPTPPSPWHAQRSPTRQRRQPPPPPPPAPPPRRRGWRGAAAAPAGRPFTGGARQNGELPTGVALFPTAPPPWCSPAGGCWWVWGPPTDGGVRL